MEEEIEDMRRWRREVESILDGRKEQERREGGDRRE